jgi:5-methylcytosine-specific restriction protein A
MKTTPIPQRSRDLVRSRERDRCARCQIPSPNGHWHHRRSRSVRDSHSHCPCNGVWLCSTCHTWAHSHPTEAREVGLILMRHQSPPGLSPFRTPTGWVLPDCEGGWTVAL